MRDVGYYNGKMHLKNYAIQCYKMRKRVIQTFFIQISTYFMNIKLKLRWKISSKIFVIDFAFYHLQPMYTVTMSS